MQIIYKEFQIFSARCNEAISIAKKGELNDALERLSKLAEDINTVIAIWEQSKLTKEIQSSGSNNSQPVQIPSWMTFDSETHKFVKYLRALVQYNMALLLYYQEKLDEAIDKLRVVDPLDSFIDPQLFLSHILNLKGVILLRLDPFKT